MTFDKSLISWWIYHLYIITSTYYTPLIANHASYSRKLTVVDRHVKIELHVMTKPFHSVAVY